QAYMDYGFDPKVMPIASLTTSEAEIRNMGFDVGEGHITAAPYFDGLENAASSVFAARFKKRYGADEPTNMCLEAAYFQVHMFAQALEQTNSMETDLLRPTILGSEFEAPQGKISINKGCSHADLWTRIGRANRSGRFEILYESNSRVSADPYLIGYGRSMAF
ncbi:MAG: transporter substrate-binding protein, partial [Phycisphaerales bacterium]|nr:transporter substrate-binding protein [Phycisphaerales bacterium]